MCYEDEHDCLDLAWQRGVNLLFTIYNTDTEIIQDKRKVKVKYLKQDGGTLQKCYDSSSKSD